MFILLDGGVPRPSLLSPNSPLLQSMFSLRTFPTRMNAPVVPDLSLFPVLIGDAFAIAVVGYAVIISLGKTLGVKHGYKVDSNQVSLQHKHSHTGASTHFRERERQVERGRERE